MNPRIFVIPLVIVAGGLVTALAVPLDPRLRVLIFAGDCCGAVVIGLVLWKREQG